MGDCVGGGAAYRGPMRHLLAALAAALAACSAAETPTRCTPGASVSCTCPGGGTGGQVCAADGSNYSTCACTTDAGTTDAPAADVVAMIDVVDAGGGTDTGPTDAGPTTDNPRCTPSTLATCATPGFGEGCWDLQTSNGQPLAQHCGACNRACTPLAPRCVAGRCTE